jgi:hypothetical protein
MITEFRIRAVQLSWYGVGLSLQVSVEMLFFVFWSCARGNSHQKLVFTMFVGLAMAGQCNPRFCYTRSRFPTVQYDLQKYAALIPRVEAHIFGQPCCPNPSMLPSPRGFAGGLIF